MLAEFILVLALSGAWPGAVGLETCPFPETLLACRVRHAKTGELIRSSQAIREFKRCTGYPKGRPGYVIDHIFPLACGGCDDPSNMIWQTRANSRLKDKWERKRPNCVPWTGEPEATRGDSNDQEASK